jgi:hypothetical protein
VAIDQLRLSVTEVPHVHGVLRGVDAGCASAGVHGVGGDHPIADREEIVTLDADLHDLGEAVEPAAKPLRALVGLRLGAHPLWHCHFEPRSQAGKQRLDFAFVQLLEEPADDLHVFRGHCDTRIARCLTTARPRPEA